MSRPARPSPIARAFAWRAARPHGFSFIEVLVVMGIIGVLVGGVLVAINIFFKKGPEFAARNTVNKVRALVDKWKLDFGAYPPSDVTKIAEVADVGEAAKAPGNPTNAGIEALYQAFYWKGFSSDPQFTDAEVANLDEDELRKAVNKLGSTALREIVDGWGNPLVYFNFQDYAKLAASGAIYNALDPETGQINEVTAYPFRTEDGTFVNPNSFQVFSMGLDGQPNTADDLTFWSQ
jgi:prepilin-type N-terminal cleavage/methylation domain-containing protein